MRINAAAPLCTPPDLRPLATEVLGALAKVRFASLASILAYAGPSGLTPEILDAWCRASLLHRATATVDQVNRVEVQYVALTPFGARALAESTGHEVHGVSSARLKRSSQKRAHELAVGDLGLSVLSLGRERAIELLALELDERRLATSMVLCGEGKGPTRVPLQADAYVLTRTDRGTSALLIEVDRGTTTLKRMALKYQAYLAWKRDQGPHRDFAVKALRVLSIAPDERRSLKLHDAALESNRGARSGFLLFAGARDISPADPGRMLMPIARPLGHDARVPLFESSGPRDPQAVALPGGFPPASVEATRSRLGIAESRTCPLAVTAPTKALAL